MEDFSEKFYDEYSIGELMKMGYTKEQAKNLLDGKNPDGTQINELPF